MKSKYGLRFLSDTDVIIVSATSFERIMDVIKGMTSLAFKDTGPKAKTYRVNYKNVPGRLNGRKE